MLRYTKGKLAIDQTAGMKYSIHGNIGRAMYKRTKNMPPKQAKPLFLLLA